ncbi:MAG: NAD(+)/NADH kinase [Phycisphaerae bacterium]|nr:NAD(+)/NADH kinase [Tepidisphaeraceae bacterium]
MRLFVVANTTRPSVQPFMDGQMAWIRERVEVVGMDDSCGVTLREVEADAILVLGGDGTLLAAARRLSGKQIPMMGINFGRLGFLANFTPDEFRTDFAKLVERELPITPRATLQVTVDREPGSAGRPMSPGDCVDGGEGLHSGAVRFSSIALNDAVIAAGPPYHMIDLALTVHSGPGTPGRIQCTGDGIIIATPSGSTAYNLSAGGPIVSLGVDAVAITPICPHSLAFRPVVVPMSSAITIAPLRTNPGTTLFCDGQASTPIAPGDRITITRADHDVLLFENPHSSAWQALAEKLHWAVGPDYNHA